MIPYASNEDCFLLMHWQSFISGEAPCLQVHSIMSDKTTEGIQIETNIADLMQYHEANHECRAKIKFTLDLREISFLAQMWAHANHMHYLILYDIYYTSGIHNSLS